jgi:hypothetical protein
VDPAALLSPLPDARGSALAEASYVLRVSLRKEQPGGGPGANHENGSEMVELFADVHASMKDKSYITLVALHARSGQSAAALPLQAVCITIRQVQQTRPMLFSSEQLPVHLWVKLPFTRFLVQHKQELRKFRKAKEPGRHERQPLPRHSILLCIPPLRFLSAPASRTGSARISAAGAKSTRQISSPARHCCTLPRRTTMRTWLTYSR